MLNKEESKQMIQEPKARMPREDRFMAGKALWKKVARSSEAMT